MPLDTCCVGAPWSPFEVVCDAAWVASYARAVGSPLSTGTHPVFPVAPEWALLTSSHHRMPTSMSAAEVGRGVHAGHDLVHHRPVEPGETITLSPVVVGADRVKAGARTVVEIRATDAGGAPVWTTRMTNIHLGVEVVGTDRPVPGEPVSAGPAGTGTVHRVERHVAADAAHVYSDLARIWNPIHTDPEIARRAGLPDVVLHGTATLAIAVDAVCELAGTSSSGVGHLSCRFAGMVTMPNTLAIEIVERGSRWGWSVSADGAVVVRDGLVDLV